MLRQASAIQHQSSSFLTVQTENSYMAGLKIIAKKCLKDPELQYSVSRLHSSGLRGHLENLLRGKGIMSDSISIQSLFQQNHKKSILDRHLNLLHVKAARLRPKRWQPISARTLASFSTRPNDASRLQYQWQNISSLHHSRQRSTCTRHFTGASALQSI